MDTLRIETAQHVDITYEAAGVGDRVIATIIDLLLQGSLLIAGVMILFSIEPGSAVPFYLLLIVLTLYHPILETLLEGQSVGKRLMKTRVARADGGRAGVGAYLLRWLIGLVEIWATGGLAAVIAVLMNRRGQRIGDMAAGTAVIRVRQDVGLAESGFVTDSSLQHEAPLPETAVLSSEDVQTIRAVLNQARSGRRNARTDALLRRTKEVVEQKMGVPPAEENAYRFLVRVLADYSAIRE